MMQAECRYRTVQYETSIKVRRYGVRWYKVEGARPGVDPAARSSHIRGDANKICAASLYPY